MDKRDVMKKIFKKILTATEIIELRGKSVVKITGGEHHSLCLLDSGELFVWGRNDGNALGLGEKWRDLIPKSEN